MNDETSDDISKQASYLGDINYANYCVFVEDDSWTLEERFNLLWKKGKEIVDEVFDIQDMPKSMQLYEENYLSRHWEKEDLGKLLFKSLKDKKTAEEEFEAKLFSITAHIQANNKIHLW